MIELARAYTGEAGLRENLIDIRPATAADAPAINALIADSALGLNVGDYSLAQMQAALASIIGVDPQLVADGCLYIAEDGGLLVGCGGWSYRRALHGYADKASPPLDPRHEPAAIRCFFIRPGWNRRGIGGRLMERCERAARAAGFRRLELLATRTAVPFYTRHGFRQLGPVELAIPDAPALVAIRMAKDLP